MGFRQELESEPISSLPLRDAIAVREETLIRAAIAVMRAHSLGCSVIVDYKLKPVGLFTERSLLNVLLQGASLDESPVVDFGERDFFCFRADEPIIRVWNAVLEKQARFVVVTDKKGQLMGVTGQRGIAEYISDCFPAQTVVQRLGSKPWMQQREGA